MHQLQKLFLIFSTHKAQILLYNTPPTYTSLQHIYSMSAHTYSSEISNQQATYIKWYTYALYSRNYVGTYVGVWIRNLIQCQLTQVQFIYISHDDILNLDS